MVSGITAGINYSIRNSLGNERIFELYGLACFVKAVFLKKCLKYHPLFLEESSS